MAKIVFDDDPGARVAIAVDIDIVAARHQGRVMAEQLGFSAGEATLVATAISELARNIVHYAGSGEIVIARVEDGGKFGVVVVARDHGPGIADVAGAMCEGFSTAGSLGLGLPGIRRIMDEFNITSAPGIGTTVTAIKWKRR